MPGRDDGAAEVAEHGGIGIDGEDGGLKHSPPSLLAPEMTLRF
jgi:hypothetical protein